MTPAACDKSKSFVTIPSGGGKKLSSYEDTLREMEAFLDGKLDNPQTVEEVEEVEEVEAVEEVEDTYADITETTTSSSIKLPETPDPDATENSSSFGDTTSRSAITSVTSDAEVESEFRADDELASMFDGFSSVFPTRKKKLTNHWRSFIRPLMWRCKWTELKIRELESQALKYAQELEPYDQTKMLELHQYTSDFCSKSFPFVRHSVRRKFMKRRKRKLVENDTDISSYMSHHNLFSYIDNKKSEQDGATTPEHDCKKEQYTKNDKLDAGDNWLKEGEDSMEQILRHIGTVQSQVHRLRNHLDMIMMKNGVRFSSSENLSLLVPCDGQTSAAQSPDFSAGNGDNMSLGSTYLPQNLSDFDIGDLVLPESIVSSYGDVAQIPDVIESTVSLLSAADITIYQPHIVESAENILDDALMQINVARDGNMSNGVSDHSANRCQNPEMKDHKISSILIKTEITPEPVVGDDMLFEKTTLKSCITSDVPPKNKRKRGERKAAPGGWNLKCSGELDGN